MSVQQLAIFLGECLKQVRDKTGMAELATISGDNVVTSHGVYTYDSTIPAPLYNGKQVWVQISEDGTAVIIGD